MAVIAQYASEIVLSYNPTDISNVDRDDAQWVNSLSSGALLELLTKVGYEIVSIRAFDATQILIKGLSNHFKSGQRLSVQNRPTEVAVQD